MGTIFAMSFYASIMAVFIIIFRALFYEKMPKATFKALWLIMALRMLIPVFIPIERNLTANDSYEYYTYWFMYNFNPAYLASLIAGELRSFDKMSSLQKSGHLFFNIMALLAFVGAIVAVLIFAYGYFKNIRKYGPSKSAQSHSISQVINSSGIRRKVNVKVSNKTQTPFTYGIFKPTIVCPENLSDYDLKTTELAISHELTHIKHFDALYKIIIAAAFCVHWFNPFAWIMLILSCRDTELACDEKILEKFPDAKKDYANSIIEFEEKRSDSPLLSRLSRSPVKKRVEFIMKAKKPAVITVIAAIVITLCTTAVSAFTPTFDISTPKEAFWQDVSEQYSSDGKYYLFGDTESTYYTIENGTITFSLDDEERMKKEYEIYFEKNDGKPLWYSPGNTYTAMSFERWLENSHANWLSGPKPCTIAKNTHTGKTVIALFPYYDQNGFLCVGTFMDYANEDTIINGEMTYIKVPE